MFGFLKDMIQKAVMLRLVWLVPKTLPSIPSPVKLKSSKHLTERYVLHAHLNTRLCLQSWKKRQIHTFNSFIVWIIPGGDDLCKCTHFVANVHALVRILMDFYVGICECMQIIFSSIHAYVQKFANAYVKGHHKSYHGAFCKTCAFATNCVHFNKMAKRII